MVGVCHDPQAAKVLEYRPIIGRLRKCQLLEDKKVEALAILRNKLSGSRSCQNEGVSSQRPECTELRSP